MSDKDDADWALSVPNGVIRPADSYSSLSMTAKEINLQRFIIFLYKMHIISTFYISKYSSYLDVSRSKELEVCIIKNLENPIVDKIHLFIDDKDALRRLNEISNSSDKIVIISVGLKPKYNDFFNYIIENIQNEICMITNADIYIHHCEVALLDKLKSFLTNG